MYQSDSVYAFGWKSIALWVDVYISTASAHELAFYNNTFLCMLYKLTPKRPGSQVTRVTCRVAGDRGDMQGEGDEGDMQG